MTRSQKKTLNHLLMILIALILLLMVLLLVKRRQESTDTGDASGSADSSQTEVAVVGITSLSYSNGSTTLSFSLGTDGAWYWDGDRDFPLDTTVIDAMMADLTPLAPIKTIAEGDALAAYGLDGDTSWCTAVYEDGTELRLDFGTQVPSSTNYYALKDGDTETVYVLSGTIPAQMDTAIFDMMDLPDLPELEEADISSVTLSGAVETVMVAFEETVKPSGGSAASSASSSAQASAAVETESVVSWRWGGQDVTDNTRLQALIAALTELELVSCENFKPSAEAVTMWGLDEPAAVVTITYGIDQTLTLRIGSETLDSEGYYVRMDDDATIYSMASDIIAPILTVAELGLTGTASSDDAAA